MRRAANKTHKKRHGPELNPPFDRAADAFEGDRQVSLGGKKGFGSGALKVNGKIFAVMSSKGEFVVKLSKERVDELVASGKGNRFDPGHGRVMREWVVAGTPSGKWVELAAKVMSSQSTASDIKRHSTGGL